MSETKTKIAKVFNAQVNPNATQRIAWENVNRALTKTDSTYANSKFTKTLYIKEYKTVTVKDKNGKSVTQKKPVYAYKYNKPWTVTAHQFDLNIPAHHKVKSFHFRVRMKVDKGLSVTVPTARFCIYGKAWDKGFSQTVDSLRGWEKGVYYVYPTRKVSTTWETYNYTMNASDWDKGGFTSSDISSTRMGVDLIFDNGTISGETDKTIYKHIYIAYVECYIEYEIPTFKISYTDNIPDIVPVSSKPIVKAPNSNIYIGDEFIVIATLNWTILKSGNGTYQVDIPQGVELISSKTLGSTFNENTGAWAVDYSNSRIVLALRMRSKVTGSQTINISHNLVGTFPFKFNVGRDGFHQAITLSQLDKEYHKNHRGCIGVDINGSLDENVDFVEIPYNVVANSNITGGVWNLNEEGNLRNVEIVSQTATQLVLKVHGEYHAYFDYCFIPTVKSSNFQIYVDKGGTRDILKFPVLDAYKYHITTDLEKENTSTDHYYILRGNHQTITDHRIITKLDVHTSNAESYSEPHDGNMVMNKSSLVMHHQEDLDYIGCVPLEHLHFDPKSTYKDTLIDTHYKNNRYMGKKLASDEDITLNVRLHPHQVTTIQGLIDMDKPIPIDANHKCFEGDALNHRGWAEIYSIKAEETNPHWYKCDIDVKYLTHNLNTRFKIDKGTQVATSEYDIAELMVETVESGSKLDGSSSTDRKDSYFYVDTDGSYAYNTDESSTPFNYLDENEETVIANGDNTTLDYHDDDGELQHITGLDYVVEFIKAEGYEVVTPVNGQPIQVKETIEVPNNQRNMFSIDEGQHIQVRTNEILSHQTVVSFEWLTSRISEIKENNIRRFIRLIDKDSDDVIFEYEYHDFEFDDNNIYCETTARVRNSTGWDSTNVGTDVDMRILTPLSNDEIEDDDYENSTSETLYGSTLRLTLNGKSLSLVDMGYNGMEYVVNDIQLTSDNYYWETYWENDNQDGETDDVTCFFDITIASTLLDGQYADKYDKLYVSPFPVVGKNLLYTREGEEGTLYYMEDDREEFSFIMNPYYQYANGTDLQNDSGASIFNLNYGYELIYIQNGLVRLGFNRLNGKLYLGKFDPVTRQWVETHRLHLKKYDDMNINSISDDKIEIQVSDSVFTIWRGHPYIMVKHNNESIYIDSKFTRIWGEQVGDENNISEYPTNWMLLNDKNLLPDCVGGLKIKSSCIENNDPNPDEIEIPDRSESTLEWHKIKWESVDDSTGQVINSGSYNNFSDAIFVTGVDYYFLINGTTDVTKENIPLSYYTGDLGISWSGIKANPNIPSIFKVIAPKNIIQNGESIRLQGEYFDYDGNGVSGKTIYFFEEYDYSSINVSSSNNPIQSGDAEKLYGRVKDEDGSLVTGVPVHFFEKFTPSSVSVSSSKNPLQLGDEEKLYGRVKDEDDSLVTGVPVYFFEKIESTSVDVSPSKNPIQKGDNIKLLGRYKDEDGSLIPNVPIHFFEDMGDNYELVYSNNGTVNDLGTSSEARVDVVDGALKIYKTSTVEGHAYYPSYASSSDNVLFECEVARMGVSQSVALYLYDSTTVSGCWFAYDDSTGKWNGAITGSSFSDINTGALQVGDRIRIRSENRVITLYHNNTVIFSKSASFDGYSIGHYTNNGREQYVKNISIWHYTLD